MQPSSDRDALVVSRANGSLLGLSMANADDSPAPQPEILAAIKGNVDVVKNILSEELGVTLDLDAASIEWIDGYINRNREAISEATRERLIDIFGSFLGEAIIQNHGGRWALHEGALGIHLQGKSWAFPFNKVEKQFKHGAGDSIRSFYTFVPKILDGSLSAAKS